MTVKVRFFASLREQVGTDGTELSFDGPQKVSEIWSRAAPDGIEPSGLLLAVNMEYTDWDHLISDGDEVAFFPPVTGG